MRSTALSKGWDSSIDKGIVGGLFFGAIMGAVEYATFRANAHLAGLRPREQLMVSAAVRRGCAVTEPTLADRAVAHARIVQLRPGGRRLASVLAWGLLAVSVIGVVVSAAVGSTVGVGAGTFSGVVWAVILVVGPPLERFVQRRPRAAEVANQRAVDASAISGRR